MVGIFLPMLPETPAAMLACARIGAVHNVVFGGFSVNSVKDRMETSQSFGFDFEKQLLLSLGYAAQIYPTIWDGLATDHPTGCHLTMDEAFSFLKESAWVLEDAGYTVIIPAWWTPAGRRRTKIRLKTATRPSKKGSTAAASKGHLSLDKIVSYSYQLPFFKNSQNRLARYALAGWTFNGLLRYESGRPLARQRGWPGMARACADGAVRRRAISPEPGTYINC